jgi:hypothetical protein
MSLLSVGSLALTLALLLGTLLITHGCVRAGCLFLACLQIPAGAYDVATGQYGFVLMSLVGGALYLRGWRRKEVRELEKPRLLRRPHLWLLADPLALVRLLESGEMAGCRD